MVPAELEKPRVTEIQVRMDCNGCVQKIKKALHGINGIYDIYIDFPQQKITIIGWADPEKIVKAIKKTRKIATICSHVEATPARPTEPQPEGGDPPPESANPPPPDAPPTETALPTEPPKDPPPPETPPPDAAAAPQPTEGQQPPASGAKDVEEVHVVYHHPPDYGYRYGYGPNPQYVQAYSSHMNNYPTPNGPGFRHEPPQPIHVSHSYNTYKPSPYVTEYEYVRPPPQYTHFSRPQPPQYTHYSRPEPPQYVHYSRTEPTTQYMHYSRPEPSQYMHHNRMEQYSEDYYHSSNNGNGNITSIFSDENPNACRIV